MWEELERLFNNSVVATLVPVLITWFLAWKYYKKAGDELKAEAELLRKASMAIVYMLEHRNAKIEVRRDDAGNPIGLIVPATARTEGKSTATGVGSNASSDS